MIIRFLVIVLTTLFSGVISANGQVKLNIGEIVLSNYKLVSNDNVISNEHDTDGPYVLIFGKMINGSENEVHLSPSSSKIYFTYNIGGRTYKKELVAMPFIDNDKLCLSESEEVTFSAGDHLLLGTPLLEKYRSTGYTEVLLQILPTIRVFYVDENSDFSIISNSIEKVTLKE